MILEAAHQQIIMEARLGQAWAQGVDEREPVDVVFGALESWILQLGDQRLMLNPALKEWWYFDSPHDSWEQTGFGPGEVLFYALGRQLAVRRLKPESQPAGSNPDDTLPRQKPDLPEVR